MKIIKEIKSILHISNFFMVNLKKTSIEYKFHSLFLDKICRLKIETFYQYILFHNINYYLHSSL